MLARKHLYGSLKFLLVLSLAVLVILSFQKAKFRVSDERSSTPRKEGNMLQTTYLLTMVITAPDNKDRRDIIRKSWKNSYITQGKRFVVMFVTGTLKASDSVKNSLMAESKTHNDMLLLPDHTESYKNLTRKVLQMFKWADQNVDYSYLLKTDDDSFVQLDTIEFELRERSSTKPLYWGWIALNEIPKRVGAWAEEKWDICEAFLPYAFGGGYVLSADLVHRLAVNADGLIMYNNEDVAVGAWVSPFELERKHDLRFAVTPRAKVTCENSSLVMHYQGVEYLEKRHQSLITTGKLCS